MEVIPFGTANNRPPLLFIHGSYCDAWVWTRHFIPAFEKAGWHGSAISLRGHGKSGEQDYINKYGIADFLDDIQMGIDRLHAQPVLIGHSLGGYLAQKYALEHKVSGLVLLASPSLLGLQGVMHHIAAYHPLLAMQLCALMTVGPAHTDMQVISNALFGDRITAETCGANMPQFQRESTRVMMEASWPDFRFPKALPPTLALGGDNDAFVPEFEFRYAAQFWHGQSKILRGVPHGMMVAPSWPEVASEIMGWLMHNFPGA